MSGSFSSSSSNDDDDGEVRVRVDSCAFVCVAAYVYAHPFVCPSDNATCSLRLLVTRAVPSCLAHILFVSRG